MIVVGERFRRKVDRSLWKVVTITYGPAKPGEQPKGRALLVPADNTPGRWEVLVADLENEVGWRRE